MHVFVVKGRLVYFEWSKMIKKTLTVTMSALPGGKCQEHNFETLNDGH